MCACACVMCASATLDLSSRILLDYLITWSLGPWIMLRVEIFCMKLRRMCALAWRRSPSLRSLLFPTFAPR